MITCKEDLINTYIENDFGELRDSYIKKAIELGFSHQGRSHKSIDWYDLKFIGICEGWDRGRLGQSDSNAEKLDDYECKKLTLSDLKPRTKVEYEKVTESIFDLKDELERGELVSKVGDQISEIKTEKHLVTQYSFGYVHRKVERPVEWFDDLTDFVKQQSSDDWELEVTNNGGVMRMTAEMTRDQWCDLARIILEQEGE